MPVDSSEYGIAEVFLVVRRAWLFLLIAPIVVAVVTGYWAFGRAAAEGQLVVVQSVVSLPAADMAIIDAQGLFSQSRQIVGRLGDADLISGTRLSTLTLGVFDWGRGSVVQLSVRSPSRQAARSAMDQFVADLRVRVRALHRDDIRVSPAGLEERISEVNALVQNLRSKPSSPDSALESNRQAALASALAALTVLEQAQTEVLRGTNPDVRMEVPPGPAAPAEEGSAARWVKTPILAAVATELVALLLALMGDAVTRVLTRLPRR